MENTYGYIRTSRQRIAGEVQEAPALDTPTGSVVLV